MGFEIIPWTQNRDVIYDLLTRAKKFHCPCSATLEIDVTQTLALIEKARSEKKDIGLVSFLVKVTSLLLEKHPRLNHHLFHGFWGKKEVAFDHISCTLIVQRNHPKGEEILFPLVLRNSNEMKIAEIHEAIRYHKRTPLKELPQMKAIQKVKSLPKWAIRLFSYKTRSDPKFFEKYYGTYGLSSVIQPDGPGVAGHAIANTCASFVPGTLKKKPIVVGENVVVRDVLTFGIILDHYLVDGLDALRAMDDVRNLIENPTLIEEEYYS